MTDHVLDGLNDAQRQAVQAVRGPVCILAGAGTGKTTTITRRIAYQIASGAFRTTDVLAVTFTDRAAAEMRARLQSLGAGKVRARTFHAQALALVAHFADPPNLLPSKVQLLSQVVRRLPAPYCFRGSKDAAAEIERAKNRRIPHDRYLDEVGDHDPPMPADLMARVYAEYEARKRRAGVIDFEDLLEGAIHLSRRPDVAEQITRSFAAFTVDEYQDVNLLQQTLLDAWLGGRDDVCVVGDDYQSIFGFTAATPKYLLGFAERHPRARVVKLEENHRSTPQVLRVANKLVPHLEGTAKVLRATRDPGPRPHIKEYRDGAVEVHAIVEAIRKLARRGMPYDEMAILYRVNARSEDFEEALSAERIPFQVRDGVFLRRPGPRAVLNRLRRADQRAAAAPSVASAARDCGWEPEEVADAEEEITRQADMTRLVRIAEERPEATVAELVDDLRRRFESEEGGRGVVLSTYHRAKGLEYDAVFLPRLEEGEIPFVLSKHDDQVAEERRLLYVGITRARVHLWMSWARTRGAKTVRPSRFVDELMPKGVLRREVKPDPEAAADPELFAQLRSWRSRTAREHNVPAYVVFHDATLRVICERCPRTLTELARIPGVGPGKLARYGSDVLEVVRAGTAG